MKCFSVEEFSEACRKIAAGSFRTGEKIKHKEPRTVITAAKANENFARITGGKIMNSEFEKELAGLINKHSIENEWDMPDFLMAELICKFIISSGTVMRRNLDWHGTDSVCHPKQDQGPA